MNQEPTFSRRRGLQLASVGVLTSALPMGTRANATSPLQGVVLDRDGSPLAGARVSDGFALAVADNNGMFGFAEGELQADRTLRFSASGYRDQTVQVREIANGSIISLEPRDIRALYINPTVITTLEQYDAIIDLINSTNVNAVVLDIKEEYVWFDTSVEFFRSAGTVAPRFGLAEILAKFRKNNIYTIARLVVFKDSIVASVRPEFAILHSQTGQPWRDQNGVAWVNPLLRDLWEPNIELAVEAATAGFDEIQYDYIRFPTDGDLTTMDFGPEFTQEARQTAIEEFLALSRHRLLPSGAKQAADVFGFIMVIDDDMGIGQNFVRVAEHLDYLCPMVYPSHYANYQFGLPGHPNEYPYEVIAISLEGGVERLMGNSRQIRPWLQDFAYPGMRSYGPADVRAQIQASEDYGTSGWMLWDPRQIFNPANFDWEQTGSVPPIRRMSSRA
jgi:hypothetical protein